MYDKDLDELQTFFHDAHTILKHDSKERPLLSSRTGAEICKKLEKLCVIIRAKTT